MWLDRTAATGALIRNQAKFNSCRSLVVAYRDLFVIDIAKVAAPEQRTTKARARIAGSFMLPKDPNCRLRAQTLRNSIATASRMESQRSMRAKREQAPLDYRALR